MSKDKTCTICVLHIYGQGQQQHKGGRFPLFFYTSGKNQNTRT